MAAVTRAAAVLDKLVSGFGSVMPTGVPVLDGPGVEMLNNDRFVVVGDDGEFQSDDPVADIEQEPAGIRAGNMPRWETATVTCTAYAADGGNSIKTARDQAVALVQACEQWLTAHQDLDQTVQYAWLTVGSLRQDQIGSDDTDAAAALVRIEFGIYYKARLA